MGLILFIASSLVFETNIYIAHTCSNTCYNCYSECIYTLAKYIIR